MGGVQAMFRAFGLMVVLGACLLGATGAARGEEPPVGVVKSAEGDVRLVRAGSTVVAAVGTEVQMRDRLRTGSDGAVGVTLEDGTLISLGSNTVFEYTEFEYAPQRGAFGFLGALLGGTMLYSSGKIGKLAPDRTRIRTPLSVIAVRGTRFAVRLPDASGE